MVRFGLSSKKQGAPSAKKNLESVFKKVDIVKGIKDIIY